MAVGGGRWHRSPPLLLSLLFLLLLLLVWRQPIPVAGDSQPPKETALVNGDLMLGALMMVHEREDEEIGCGDVFVQGGVQAVEAMLFTLDYVNRNRIIPYTTLGAQILDDCDKDTFGLQQALNFIKGRVDTLQNANVVCYVNKTERISTKPTTGVVAASSSVTSIQVANLLKLFNIPQVSYFSSTPELSDRNRYPYFYRTIPSDKGQVSAMRAILKYFDWKFVSVIYEDSSYGIGAFALLEQFLNEDGICIAYKNKLPKDFEVGRPEYFIPIVKELQLMQIHRKNARGVILYGSDQEVRGFMNAVRKVGATGQFTFIGSDGWSAREDVYKPDGLQKEVVGTISVQPMAKEMRDFDHYFRSLTVENNLRNPWFYEMWERVFRCRYPDKPDSRNNLRYNRTCNGTEALEKVAVEKQLQFVSDAVLVFAYALRDYFQRECGDDEECINCYNGRTQTPECVDKHVDGTLLRDIMNNVTFVGLAGNRFEFETGHSDPPPNYNIIHFREFPDREAGWLSIGNFTKDGLILDMDKVEFYVKHESRKPPPSYCTAECREDQVKHPTGTRCCWDCMNCKEDEIRVNETTCLTCDLGWRPNPLNRSECLMTAVQKVEALSVYGVLCLLIAVIGVVCALLQLAIFIKHNDTPVVKASGRELSYVIIVGLFLCFSVTPLMFVQPTMFVCGTQRFMAGFCFTVVYAAILTKTNRIARIFRSGRRTIRRPNFISPTSQLAICALIVAVQVVMVGVWLFASPPAPRMLHPQRYENRLVCSEAVSNYYLLAYAYPIFLCIICTVYAVKTRKMPEAFNESHYIAAVVYTTCVIWLAFVPVYIVAKDSIAIRVTSVCVSTSLTAFVCQFCLFWPKVYIILFKPERNVRAAIMGPKSAGASKSLIRSASTVGGNPPSMTNMFRADESSGGYSEDEYNYNMATGGRRSDSRQTVATQTSPLHSVCDERGSPEEAAAAATVDRSVATGGCGVGVSVGVGVGGFGVGGLAGTRREDYPPSYASATALETPSRTLTNPLSPSTPIAALIAIGTSLPIGVNSKCSTPLSEQIASAPYIDCDSGSTTIVGNGIIVEQGDVSL